MKQKIRVTFMKHQFTIGEFIFHQRQCKRGRAQSKDWSIANGYHQAVDINFRKRKLFPIISLTPEHSLGFSNIRWRGSWKCEKWMDSIKDWRRRLWVSSAVNDSRWLLIATKVILFRYIRLTERIWSCWRSMAGSSVTFLCEATSSLPELSWSTGIEDVTERADVENALIFVSIDASTTATHKCAI